MKNIASMKGFTFDLRLAIGCDRQRGGTSSEAVPGLQIVNGFSEAEVAQFLKAGDSTATKPVCDEKVVMRLSCIVRCSQVLSEGPLIVLKQHLTQ